MAHPRQIRLHLQGWFRIGSGLVQGWFTVWSRVSSELLHGCFMAGSGLVQDWFRIGSGLVQDWFRVGSGFVQGCCKSLPSLTVRALIHTGLESARYKPLARLVWPSGDVDYCIRRPDLVQFFRLCNYWFVKVGSFIYFSGALPPADIELLMKMTDQRGARFQKGKLLSVKRSKR